MNWWAISFICACFFLTGAPLFANEAKQAGVRPIAWDDLERLGIDEGNNLYWDNKQVIVKKEYSLDAGAQWAAIIGAAGILLSGIGTLLSGIAKCRIVAHKKSDDS